MSLRGGGVLMNDANPRVETPEHFHAHTLTHEDTGKRLPCVEQEAGLYQAPTACVFLTWTS